MHKKYHFRYIKFEKTTKCYSSLCLKFLIDRNEHNDSGGYKGKYDVEIDRFAVYKQHVA